MASDDLEESKQSRNFLSGELKKISRGPNVWIDGWSESTKGTADGKIPKPEQRVDELETLHKKRGLDDNWNTGSTQVML